MTLAQHAHGHGYLTRPTSRRLNEKSSFYTGITAFGAGQHITNCGKDGLSTPSSQDVITDLKRGSIQQFDIVIDAHHAGHLEMRLCPFIVDGDDQDLFSCTLLQRASAAEAGVNDCTTNDDRDICASIAPKTGAPCSSHGRLPTAVTLTPPHIATTTITWWGHRTHGATIGTVATSVTLAAARLTTAKQPQAIDCVAARCSRIVLRSSWLKKAAMQHLRPPLQLLLLRSWSLCQSLSLSLSQNQRRSQHHRQHHRHNQSQRRTLQKAVPARENLALILRIAAPNGALVVQAARTAMQNPLGHPRVAPRLNLPRAPALGSLAAMPLIADRNGAIVVRPPRTAMQIQLGQQTVACPFLRINTRSMRPAPCVAIGVSLARVSFRRAVNTCSV